MTAIIIFVFTISYLVSAYMSWYYVNKAYNKGGRYYGDKVDVNDIVFSFYLSQICSIGLFVGYYIHLLREKELK